MTQTNNGAAVWVRRVLTAWLAAAALEYVLLPGPLRDLEGQAGLRAMSLLRLGLVTAAGIALQAGIGLLFQRGGARLPKGPARFVRPGLAGRLWLPLTFGLLAALALSASFSPALLGGCLLIFLLLAYYALRGWEESPEPGARPEKPKRIWGWLTALAALVFFVWVSAWTVARVRTLVVPSYDFGIFSQMFNAMRRTGLPVTTLERGYPLSHFAVHVSPIYYLLLPFYFLVPRPETLQILQAAVMASAVLPLWKLGGLHGLTGPRRFLLCLLLLLAPAFAGGAGFDLHENCFLTVLLLWLLWAVDSGSRPAGVLAALLTLCVKEDAAMYLGVVGLFVLLRAALRPEQRKQLAAGLLLLGAALAWFAGATWWLRREGQGVMVERYATLLYDDTGSLLALVKAALLSPMKLLRECLDAEKLPYIGLTMGVLLALPLWTRRYERFVLLIPWVLVNLLSCYLYQYDVHYQYSFGSLACLLYLCCVNLEPRSGLRPLPKAGQKGIRPTRLVPAALALAVAVSAFFFWEENGMLCLRNVKRMLRPSASVTEARQVLAQIPREAAVTASTFYTTPLSDREILYDIDYVETARLLDSDYVIISPTDELWNYCSASGAKDGRENLEALLRQNGFRRLALSERVSVWEKQRN